MTSLFFSPSSLLFPPSSFPPSSFPQSSLPPFQKLKPFSLQLTSPLSSRRPLKSSSSSSSSQAQPTEGTVSVINFEDFIEKDWSFLEIDTLNSPQQQSDKFNRIISAGEIENSSRVLVSICSEDFVDRLVDSSVSQLLLVVHDSLFVLAGIKEKYDKVKCWQGEIIYVPEKWVPFDVVFLNYLPALPFSLDQIFGALAERCLPGARIVISHSQGKEILEQQRKEYPDVVISNLPDKTTLEKVITDHSFDLTEFVDEPGLYLAVLKFSGKGSSTT